MGSLWSFPASRAMYARIGRHLPPIGPSSVSYILNGRRCDPTTSLPRLLATRDGMVGFCLELRDCRDWNVHRQLVSSVLAERHCLIPREGSGGGKLAPIWPEQIQNNSIQQKKHFDWTDTVQCLSSPREGHIDSSQSSCRGINTELGAQASGPVT